MSAAYDYLIKLLLIGDSGAAPNHALTIPSIAELGQCTCLFLLLQVLESRQSSCALRMTRSHRALSPRLGARTPPDPDG